MPPRPFASRTRAALALLLVASACGGQVKVKASANAKEDDNATFTANAPPSTSSSATPAASSAPTSTAPVAITAPPSDACPLTCFEARGSERVNVTAEEQTQLRSALEPVLGTMRSCVSAEDWRSHGSPVINLRIAPDGGLADLGIDPHHGHEQICFDDSARGANISLALPGRKVVRCSERCGHDTTRGATRRRRR